MRDVVFGTVAAAVVVVVVASGCGGSSHATGPPGSAVTVRTCAMVGSGGLAPDWRRHALILGPRALARLRDYNARQPLPPSVGDRHGAYEVIAIVRAGARVTLSLPAAEWASVGLIYVPRKFRDDGAYRIGELDRAVRFEACRSPAFNHGVSQFDGGFVVARPQCVRFAVTTSARKAFTGAFPAAASCRYR